MKKQVLNTTDVMLFQHFFYLAEHKPNLPKTYTASQNQRIWTARHVPRLQR